MARNLICAATGERCNDGRCKIGFCIAEIEVRRLAGQAEALFSERNIAAHKAEDLAEAIKIVEDVIKTGKGKRP